MEIENTLSNEINQQEAAEGQTVVVVQQTPEASAEDSQRSAQLDAQPVDETGLPAVVKSVFGEYHPRTQTVTETLTDGTVLTSVECVPGIAGLDWYWISGVLLFAMVLWSFFRFVGGIFKR